MMARMRTLPETAAYLKEQDPQTAVTLTALRRMVKTGELSYVTVGVKRLINLDVLISHLGNETPQPIQQITVSGIRPIPEKISYKKLKL